jgi:hypothetical protein
MGESVQVLDDGAVGNRLPHGLGRCTHWVDILGGGLGGVNLNPAQRQPLEPELVGSSANNFPFREHLLHLLYSAGAGVFLLCLGIPHDEFFLMCERQAIELLSELCAQFLLQRRGNLDLSLLAIRFEGDSSDIARSYACVPPCLGIHNDVLLTATVPNRAAPSVAVDRHFDGHFGSAPHISRVERQREICTGVSP